MASREAEPSAEKKKSSGLLSAIGGLALIGIGLVIGADIAHGFLSHRKSL